MTTAVSICSNAIQRLGGEPISSFDEADATGANIERVRAAAGLWPTIRRRVLRGGVWNCALKRVLLSPDTDAPAFGYANRFQLPPDWLRTVALGNESWSRFDFVTETGFILCDEAELPLLYVYDNQVPSTYDAALVDALEVSMMAVLAYPVTRSTSLAAEIQALARDTLQGARSIDGQDDPPNVLGDSPLTASRYARGRR